MEEAILRLSAPYFCEPYQRDRNDYVERMGIRVWRPNHCLHHSACQLFLAGAIVDMIGDPILGGEKSRIEMAAAFQRSGRESEGSRESLQEVYDAYELADLRNFDTASRRLGIFSDFQRQVYRESIRWSTADGETFPHSPVVRDVIQAAHILHLRRMPSFDAERIKREAVEKLENYIDDASGTVERVWDLCGRYLEATGDRDLVRGKRTFSDRFFILSNDPTLLAQTLKSVTP